MPVLIISPNGSITEKASLVVAVLDHPNQINPLLNNTNKKTLVITTDMTQTTTTLAIPADVEIQFANHAVYTVQSGQTLDLSQCQFQKPNYDCFVLQGTGQVLYPVGGPGPVQNWSVKELLATVIKAASAVFTGVVQATGFTGPLTGDVTGTASLALNSNKLGNIPYTPTNKQRIISGYINNTTSGTGAGFTWLWSGAVCTITFNPIFAASPIVALGVVGDTYSAVIIGTVTATSVTVQGATMNGVGTPATRLFNFIAIGLDT